MKDSKLIAKAIVITAAIVGIIAFFFMIAGEVFYKQEDNTITREYIVVNGKNYIKNEDIELVLITGLDSFEVEIDEGYMNDDLADFLYLLVINKSDKTITPIHINRDSMVNYQRLGPMGDIVGYSYGQVALSHTYGDGGLTSLCNVKDAISDLFYGVHIDYYASLTMDAVPIINDSVGGVTVYVEDDFGGIDDSLIQGQECLLLGDSSLLFVRARGEMKDSTNLTRMKRQRAYMNAIYKKFMETVINDDSYSKNILQEISPYMVSSANITELQMFIKLVKDYKLLETQILNGEARLGEKNIEYYIDMKNLNELTIKYLLEEA